MPAIIECESGSYTLVDAHGKDIDVGSAVRYGGTGTRGKVTEIICDGEGAWAVLDSTGLLYRLESLKVLDELETKAEMGERTFSRDEIQKQLEESAETAKEAARLDDTNLEAGG